jgi:hypothetical protein
VTTIQEARQALADAVSTLPDVTCVARPVPGNTRPGDAWVTVSRTAPGQYIGSVQVTLSAFVVLGSDERLADQKVDELSVLLLEATYPLYGIAPAVEPQVITAGEAVTANLYALALSVTLEIA